MPSIITLGLGQQYRMPAPCDICTLCLLSPFVPISDICITLVYSQEGKIDLSTRMAVVQPRASFILPGSSMNVPPLSGKYLISLSE